MGTVKKGFDARLANIPFLVFDFQAPWRSTIKWSVSQPGVESVKLI